MERRTILHGIREGGAEPAWYCLRSQPKHEHIGAAHLRLLEDVTVFCPRLRFKRATRKGVVWATEAMFPGYLFARFDLATMHRSVCYAHGISGIVRFADRYPTVEAGALSQLIDQTDESGVNELSYNLAQGDDVKIVGGAFAGLNAVITQVLPAKERVRILMDFLGRKLEAEVESSKVLRYTQHPLAA